MSRCSRIRQNSGHSQASGVRSPDAHSTRILANSATYLPPNWAAGRGYVAVAEFARIRGILRRVAFAALTALQPEFWRIRLHILELGRRSRICAVAEFARIRAFSASDVRRLMKQLAVTKTPNFWRIRLQHPRIGPQVEAMAAVAEFARIRGSSPASDVRDLTCALNPNSGEFGYTHTSNWVAVEDMTL